MSTTVIIAWIHFRDFSNVILDWAELWFRKRMAETEVRKCLDWLDEKKGEFELAAYGGNNRFVCDASQKHGTSRAQIMQYRKQMDKLSDKQTLTDAELQSMYGAYNMLETLADKKTACLEMIKGIASLEDHIQTLSSEFDSRTVHLVNVSQNNKPNNNGKDLGQETLARATQSCISAVRQSWKWLDEVMQCAHVHLANSSAYHQFFHDVEETDYFMNSTLSNMHATFQRNNLSGDRADLNSMSNEIKETLTAYLRWQSKVDNLMARSRDIVPVHKRTFPCKDPQLVLALASYKTDEIEFEEGETLTLLDNTNSAKWKIKNGKGETGSAPAVILLINGPTGEALDAAVRLRLQLLGLWTSSVKRLGYQMISFMQLVFKDMSEDEVKAMNKMSKPDRDELLRILDLVDTTLQKNWQGYGDFDKLQEKIVSLKTTLNEAETSQGTKGGKVPGEIVVQVKMLEDLLSGYKDFWTYWETYKMMAEISQQPKYILVCDKWDQLRYTSSAHYVRFWDTNLNYPGEDGKMYKAEAALTIHETPKSKLDSGDSSSGEFLIQSTSASTVESSRDQFKRNSKGGDQDGLIEREENSESYMTQNSATMDGSDVWSSSGTEVRDTKQRQEATMDEVQTSMEEVQTTFVIKTVLHPTTQKEMSLEEAVNEGIIDQEEGKYINTATGEKFSLQQAMGNGDILVEFKSQRTVKKEKSSYGVVTIKTSKETRPYTLHAVLEPKTEKKISVEEAEKRGILNISKSTYTTETGEVLSIVDAIQSGLIKATFHGTPEDSVEESKTYAVTSVTDQRRKMKLTFNDALNKGLFDVENGTYVNNVTQERMTFEEAVIEGFIKARVVTDESALDIDPANRIVLDKLSAAQQKIIKQVRVARAFKQATGQINGKK